MMSGDKESKGDQQCCLADNNERCRRQSGNASFNFRVQKLVEQRKLKFSLDTHVRIILVSHGASVGFLI